MNTGRTQEGEEKPPGFGGLNEPLIMGGGIAWWSIATLVLYRFALLLENERVRGRKRRPPVILLIIVAGAVLACLVGSFSVVGWGGVGRGVGAKCW